MIQTMVQDRGSSIISIKKDLTNVRSFLFNYFTDYLIFEVSAPVLWIVN